MRRAAGNARAGTGGVEAAWLPKRSLRLLLLVRRVVRPLVLWTMWRWSLLIPMWGVALVVAPLSEPAVPSAITVAAEASFLSPFIIPPGAIVRRMSPEVRVEARTVKVCAIVDFLVVAVPVPGTVAMSATAHTTTTTYASSAAAGSVSPSSSTTTVVAYAACSWCRHVCTHNLHIRRMN